MATNNGKQPQSPNSPSRITTTNGKPAIPPHNVRLGGGSGFTRNVYGAGGTGYNDDVDLRQWRARNGTSQQRYSTTRLPGEP